MECPASGVQPQPTGPPWQPDLLQNKYSCRVQPELGMASRISFSTTLLLRFGIKSGNGCLGVWTPNEARSSVAPPVVPGVVSLTPACQPPQHSCGRDCRLDRGQRRRRRRKRKTGRKGEKEKVDQLKSYNRTMSHHKNTDSTVKSYIFVQIECMLAYFLHAHCISLPECVKGKGVMFE